MGVGLRLLGPFWSWLGQNRLPWMLFIHCHINYFFFFSIYLSIVFMKKIRVAGCIHNLFHLLLYHCNTFGLVRSLLLKLYVTCYCHRIRCTNFQAFIIWYLNGIWQVQYLLNCNHAHSRCGRCHPY